MPYLEKALRKQLATTIQQARAVAEDGAADALRRIGVAEDKSPAHLTGTAADLRVKLRAHARTLGDGWDAEKKHLLSITKLVETVAFEHWHRMLFGRFLVERGLLIHPDLGVAVAQEELAELASEEGLPDAWALVERIAAPALPAVFKPEDPALAVTLAPEFAKRLRDLVATLPREVFVANDSLGWTYQFWRAAEKDAVNKASGKIGAAELPAVTQLFTEPYMVKFLLHNTLGAWWAGKVLGRDPELARDAADEAALRDACALPGVEWEFLRFVRDGDGTSPWRPAAGTFPGWPQRAADITFLDPCCGSGHFLVEAFALLAALRIAEEGFSGEDAARAVLRDNLHGLEIDGRCVQIAAFNVALAAWGRAGGAVTLPRPHIAWVGAPPPLSRSEIAALANGDVGLRRALEALHDQFAQAPLLGSLLEVGAKDLLDSDLRNRGDLALQSLRSSEPEMAEGVLAARGLLDAANLLARAYVLVATNVPFLGRAKQDATLAAHIGLRFPSAKADLATTMLARMNILAATGGSVAAISGQNWWYLDRYKEFRREILTTKTLCLFLQLGSDSFSTPMFFFNVGITVSTNSSPHNCSKFSTIDASPFREAEDKALGVRECEVKTIMQDSQKKNPDWRISVDKVVSGNLLSEFAYSYQGLSTGDNPRFRRLHWEVMELKPRWAPEQSTVSATRHYGGRSGILLWDNGKGELYEFGRQNVATLHNVDRRGEEAWGQNGIAISQMSDLPASLYGGHQFDTNVAVIVPNDQKHLPAIWAFCSSQDYLGAVRQIDRKLNVTNSTLVKVVFDEQHWNKIASARYPKGLPEPYSDDPTQWIFHGHPAYAEQGAELHVALARLGGYRWPAETDRKMRLSDLARERIQQAAALPPPDPDGLLTLHATGMDRPLADRLRTMLAAAYGKALTPLQEGELVRAADERFDKKAARDAALETWLRDRAFRQHCVLFQQRPVLWQVWDGGRDGFSAFLHYHRLTRAALEKLTYTLLGDWIARMKAAGRTAEEGWALQLRQRLVAILEGEKPYDIFVRWKPLERQPIGWEPDLDDGVRLNSRPFIEAEVLRDTPKINWNKDRGTDPSSAPWFDLGPEYGEAKGARINDHHLTLTEKRAAREKAKP